ncbi:tetratricopeptide repeat protein [Acaryochloris marina]|uniref:tetratricopeptide repeat protein n=1 Tax=Acaryochloris marina TaxID=155978 RepID=UPI0021C34A52|nr:tetratricopeptide repeat protein [Acaryochloris marina]
MLPHLQRQTPTALIEALRQGLNTFVGAEEEGREKSLTVSLDYSFEALSERTRQHLPFLALFSERVFADWLYFFSRDPESEWGQVYREVFGENLQQADWMAILQEAAAASIVEPLGATIFQIHPALPWYLRQRLSQQAVKAGVDAADGGIANLEKKLLSFYGSLATHYEQQLISNAEEASFVLRVEEPNLLQQLRLAEQQEDWGNAQYLLQALGELYKRIGRKPELRALCEQGLFQVGIRLSEVRDKGSDASEFWMYLQGRKANDALEAADIDGAREILEELLAELELLRDPKFGSKIAVAQHQLGRVAEKQRRFDDAIALYQKALKIFEDAGDLYSAARDYYLLGRVAEAQENYSEALQYYILTLAIALEHNQDLIPLSLQALGQMLKQFGTDNFKSRWRKITQAECPDEYFSAIQTASQQSEN